MFTQYIQYLHNIYNIYTKYTISTQYIYNTFNLYHGFDVHSRGSVTFPKCAFSITFDFCVLPVKNCMCFFVCVSFMCTCVLRSRSLLTFAFSLSKICHPHPPTGTQLVAKRDKLDSLDIPCSNFFVTSHIHTCMHWRQRILSIVSHLINLPTGKQTVCNS